MFKPWTKSDVIMDHMYTTDKKKWYVIKDIQSTHVVMGNGIEVGYDELAAHWLYSPDACNDIKPCHIGDPGWFLISYIEKGTGEERSAVWWYDGSSKWSRSVGDITQYTGTKPLKVFEQVIVGKTT